jgi:site-specific DNA-methyltransferase (adenine-specific)
MKQELWLGDCFELMKNIEDNSINAVITDLPYGTTSNKWDSILPLDILWKEYLRIGKENAVYIFTSCQPFTTTLINSNADMWKHEWIWIKNRGSNFANTVREPFKEHETVQVFSKGKWTYNKQMQSRADAGLSRVKYKLNQRSKSENYREFEGREGTTQGEFRVPSSCQKFNVEVGLHPTQKPVKLMEYLVKTYTNVNDIILDNCCGSGSTLVAAKKLKRQFIGIEKEQEYYDIALERLKKLDQGIKFD